MIFFKRKGLSCITELKDSRWIYTEIRILDLLLRIWQLDFPNYALQPPITELTLFPFCIMSSNKALGLVEEFCSINFSVANTTYTSYALGRFQQATG